MCSTPLGVTDLVTVISPSDAEIWTRCSTPLGVTDLVTPAGSGSAGGQCQCSTPLGVTDLVTPLEPRWLLATGERCSTPLGVTDLVTHADSFLVHAIGAQRLSASQTWSPGRRPSRSPAA